MPEEIVALAELRYDLLISLGDLPNPTFALQKLAEFKRDIADIGIPATIGKWREWLKHEGQ